MPVVGSAEIIVTAITSGFKQQIKQAFRDARPEAEKEGERYGKAFGNKFRIQLKNDIKQAFRENRDWVKEEGGRQGKSFGTEFSKSFITEFQARLPQAFENVLGDPSKTGEDYGEKFSKAMKRGAKKGGPVSLEDIVESPEAAAAAAAPERGVPGAIRPPQREQPSIFSAGRERLEGALRLEEAEKAYDKLRALADEHTAALHDIAQKSADDAVNLERAKLTRIETERERQEAVDDDRLSAHLAQVLKAAQIEESVAKSMADYSAEREQEARANLEMTIAQLKAAAREITGARVQAGGPLAARKEQQAAKQNYDEMRELSNRSALEAARSEREKLENTDKYLLALEKVLDRERDRDKARQQKKSIAAAEAAIRDAKVEADAARRAAEASMRWSDAASKRAIADAKTTAEALQRLREADQPRGARLTRTTIGLAEEEHERLKQLRKEAEGERDAAESERLSDYQRLTEEEYALARRRDDMIAASGRARARAEREYINQALAVQQAADRARVSAGAADVTRVRHETVKVDVDRSAARIDLYKEGRAAGSSFFRGFTPEFMSKAESARKAFLKLYAIGQTIGPGIALAIGGIASLGSGLVSLAASAVQASGSLIVLPGIIGALGQAAITAMIAFKGIGEAIGSGFKASEAAAADTTGATLAQARAIADARKALSRAYQDNARRMRDANRAVGDAEENLAETQNEARIAQNALTGARRRAMETLEDLEFSLEGAVLSEEEAVLRLQRATEALAEVRANPASTAQELQEASLNYREAELALRMAQDALQDVQEEQAAAAAAGVEGSAEVVDAQNDIIDANNRVADAQEALARAQEDRDDTAIQNSRAIADAQERLTEALENQANASGGAKAAADAYEAALAKLSPPAREFVTYIVSLKDQVGKLKEAAGAELFGPLTDGVKNVVENFFPALEETLRITGAAIGDFATSITDVIASSGFVARFTQIAEDNTDTIRRFGDIIAGVIDGISGVLVAAGPLIDRFTSFLSDKARDFQAFATSGEGIEKMARFFEHAGDTAAKFGEIIGNLISAFGGLVSAADSSGQTMLDRLIGISERFEAFTTGVSGHTELEDYFNKAGENARQVTGLIWDVIKAFASLGDQAGVGEAAATLRRDWVPVLKDILENLADAGGALANVATGVTRIVRAFMDSASIEAFLTTLDLIVTTIANLLELPLVRYILDIVGPIAGVLHALALVALAIEGIKLVTIGTIASISGLGASLAGVWGSVLSGLLLAQTAIGVLAIDMAAAYTAAAAGSAAFTVFGFSLGGAAAAARVLGGALMTMLLNPVGLAIAAIAALVGVFFLWRKSTQEAKAATAEFNDTLDQTTGLATDQTLPKYLESIGETAEYAMEAAGISLEQYADVIRGGEEELKEYEQALIDQGYSQETVAGFVNDTKKAQDGYHQALADGKSTIEENNKLHGLAAIEADKQTRALDALTIARADDNEIAKIAADLQSKLNEEYMKAVDAFTTLNKSGINQERTNQRIEEGYDDLAGSIVSGSDAVKDYEGDLDKLTDTQLANLAAGDAAVKNLNIQEESGRAARAAILEMVEAADAKYKADLEAAASSGDVAAATAIATDEYNKSRDAIKGTATEMGVTELAYDDFVAKITAPIDEQQIHFRAIFEEQQIIAQVEQLGAHTQARVKLFMEESGDYSPEGVARAIGKALAENPSLIAEIPVDVLENTVAQAVKDIEDVLVGPDGKPREASILTGVDKDKYEDAMDILAAAQYDENGKPRNAVYWTEAEQNQLKILRDELQELRMPGGKPRTVPLSPDDEGKIAAKEKELAALEATRTTKLNIEVNTIYTSNIAKAVAEFNATKGNANKFDPGRTLWDLIASGKVKINADGSLSVVPGKAEGGAITGPGGPKDDRAGLYRLSQGEFVLSAKAVQQLGGTATVDALHKALKSGLKPPRMATGGIMPAKAGGTLTMLAEGGRAERVEPLDANGLSAADRAILAALKDMKAQGFMVNIGMIQAPTPVAAAKEVVAAVRAETYRMGMFS